MKPILNALTFDIEDYFQVSAFENHIPRETWDEYPSRLVGNTQRLLALLDRHEVKATFFVLGWVADRFPQLVRDIRDGGHELASHGYWHRLIYNQTPDEFAADLRQSVQAIEAASNVRPTAYRAPSFSITAKTQWAHAVLIEEGFTIDSSVFPIYHDRYGIPNARRHPYRISTNAGSLTEFPPAVLRFMRMNIPVSGGGYFRLYPLCWTSFLLRWFNRSTRQPFVFYLHPWEIDPDQPRVRAASRRSKFRHYVNLSSTFKKLEGLLGQFRFGTLTDALVSAPSPVLPTAAPSKPRSALASPFVRPHTAI